MLHWFHRTWITKVSFCISSVSPSLALTWGRPLSQVEKGTLVYLDQTGDNHPVQFATTFIGNVNKYNVPVPHLMCYNSCFSWNMISWTIPWQQSRNKLSPHLSYYSFVYMLYYLAPTKPVFVGPKAEPIVRMGLSTLLKYKSDCTVFVKKKLYQAIEKTLSVVMIFQ